jgi:hypothetical protein
MVDMQCLQCVKDWLVAYWTDLSVLEHFIIWCIYIPLVLVLIDSTQHFDRHVLYTMKLFLPRDLVPWSLGNIQHSSKGGLLVV